ncbi:helix-turn-helix domain-containing protein [Actinokineospora sp. G85]|uniref:helix-turn-helix domain-containing protein n=1 Tax=Actinokineospora sp. G85 TaxID=3406626 RepID=UPI003C796624
MPGVRPGWCRRGRAGCRAGLTSGGWAGWSKSWIVVGSCAGSATISAGPWPGGSDLIVRLFRTRHGLRGVSCLLHRMGFSSQVPVHRAVERGEDAVVAWWRETWPAGER